jgi:hypothetical protein
VILSLFRSSFFPRAIFVFFIRIGFWGEYRARSPKLLLGSIGLTGTAGYPAPGMLFADTIGRGYYRTNSGLDNGTVICLSTDVDRSPAQHLALQVAIEVGDILLVQEQLFSEGNFCLFHKIGF